MQDGDKFEEVYGVFGKCQLLRDMSTPQASLTAKNLAAVGM